MKANRKRMATRRRTDIYRRMGIKLKVRRMQRDTHYVNENHSQLMRIIPDYASADPMTTHDQQHHHGGGHASPDRHAGHSVAMFRDKFWLSLALTVPTLVWGHMLPRLTGAMPPMFPGSEWI